MKKTTLVSLSLAGACAFATDWTWVESGQTDRRMSTAANWSGGTSPVGNVKTTRLFFCAEGDAPHENLTFANDYEQGLAALRFYLNKNLQSATFTGNPLYLGDDGLRGEESGLAGQQVTFDVPVYCAYSNKCSYVMPAAGQAFYFKKPFRNAFEAQDAKKASSGAYFRFGGAGTNYIDGGIMIPYANTSDGYRQNGVDSGTTVVRSDVTLPGLHMESGKLIVTGGATLTTTGANMSFLRGGTIEIENGAMLLSNAATAQQNEKYSIVFDVRDGGVLDTGVNGFRSGNDGAATYNVHDGGIFYWRHDSYTAEKGASAINLLGGKLVMGNAGVNKLKLGHSSTAIQLPNNEDTMLVKGGLLHASGIMAVVPKAETPQRHVRLWLDGGTFLVGASGDFTTCGLSAVADTLVTRMRAGGLNFDTAGYDTTWTSAIQATDEAGSTTGAFTKLGKGTLTFSAASAADFVVKGGTLKAGADADLAGRAVSLRPQAVLAFTGGELAFASLASKWGVARLACGSQKLALSSALSIDGKLVFDLVDGSGNAFGTDGVYELLSAPSLDSSAAASCAVLAPVSGKSYEFSVSDGTLSVTIAAGTAPAAPEFPAAERADDVVGAGETRSVDSETAAPAFLDGGTISYAGAEAFTLPLNRTMVTGSGTSKVRREANAGELTLAGPVTFEKGNNATLLFENGDSSAETVFSGFWFFPAFSEIVRFGEGRFRFASGSSFVSQANTVRFGGDASNVRTETTIDDGAKLSVANFSTGPMINYAVNAPSVVTQNGGEVEVTNEAKLGSAGSDVETPYVVNGGSLHSGDSAWFNLIYGVPSLTVNGGEVSLGLLSFGYRDSADADRSIDSVGARRSLTVNGGKAEVRKGFSWNSDANNDANVGVKVTGGSLALPPTVRPQETNGKTSNSATLELDGGTLALNGGSGFSGASANDYLHGADSVSVGANGATVSSSVDAAVKQPVRATTREGGDFVKNGPGTLTLASANVVFGAIDVREGKLVAPLEQRAGANTPYPAGLLALWDFDGDDPLADKSGHGHDLIQYSEENQVQFTEGDADKGFARSGKCGYWSAAGRAVACTNFLSAPLLRSTVCAWFRFKNAPSGYCNVFSTRPNRTFTGNGGYYDFTWKNSKWLASCWGGDKVNYYSQENLTTKTWHHLAVARDHANMAIYLDGVCVTNYTETILGNWRNNGILNSGYAFSIGMGTAGSEFMSAGGMIDDVAIFGRRLSAEEIAAMCADVPGASSNAVKVAAGAEWDMAGKDATASSLSGGGRVTNGKLTLAGTLAPSADGSLYVADFAAPSATGTIDLGRADDPIPQIGVTDLATFGAIDAASAENLAKWTVVNSGLSRRVRAKLKWVDGKLVYETEGVGTVVIVR